MTWQRRLNWLLAALIALVSVPSAIAVVGVVLGTVNESVGWLRYRLPAECFWVFVATAVASPFAGVGTLLLLWTLRNRWALVIDSRTGRRLRLLLIVASLAAVAAPAVWIVLFAEVFFVSGGSR